MRRGFLLLSGRLRLPKQPAALARRLLCRRPGLGRARAHDPFSPDPAGGGGGSSDDGWSDAGGSRAASDDEGGGRSDAGDEGGDSEDLESMLQAQMEGGSD